MDNSNENPGTDPESQFQELDREAQELLELVQKCEDLTPKDLDGTQKTKRNAELFNIKTVPELYVYQRQDKTVLPEDIQEIGDDFAIVRERLVKLIQNPTSAGQHDLLDLPELT